MNMHHLNSYIDLAKKAALKAGAVHLKYFEKDKQIFVKSNEYDLVTNADKEAEDVIVNCIKACYPEHSFLMEEGGKIDMQSDFTWIIDPLDGTTNYSHNFPHFAVSIGLVHKNEIIVGVVYDAVKNELFWAGAGYGAFLNGNRIKTSSTKLLETSLLATGFPYDRENKRSFNINYFAQFMELCHAVRRPGAAALDLCYVACGRLDGFWEMKLNPWDVTAGSLIIWEAGGTVTNFFSPQLDIYTKTIVASNGYIHDQIQHVLKRPIDRLFFS